jgi:hypothetical protein
LSSFDKSEKHKGVRDLIIIESKKFLLLQSFYFVRRLFSALSVIKENIAIGQQSTTDFKTDFRPTQAQGEQSMDDTYDKKPP